MSDKKTLDAAMRAHANINTLGGVIALLEACIHSNAVSDKATNQIIALCRKEQQRLLKPMDAAIDKIVSDIPLRFCAASSDGECSHSQCPQIRDNEPANSGRHCPIDRRGET